MQNKLNQFFNASFSLDGKDYKVSEAKVNNMKAVIITDRKTFVLYESELDELIGKIEFIYALTAKGLQPDFRQTAVLKNNVLNAEIIKCNGLSTRLSDKLEAVFNLLDESPTEENFKKAKGMQDIANAIVNVQMANYKFITLNK